MNEKSQLTIASLFSVLLLTIHLSDDIIRGVSGGGRENLPALFIVGLVLFCATAFAGRRLGHICAFIIGFAAFGMPILHMKGIGVGEGSKVADYAHSFRFIWTLLALGVSGAYGMILSARGLWGLRKGQTP